MVVGLEGVHLQQERIAEPSIDEHGLEADIDPLMRWQAEDVLEYLCGVRMRNVPAKPRERWHFGAAIAHRSHVLRCLSIIDHNQEITTRGLRGCELIRDILADPAISRLGPGNAALLIADHEPRDTCRAIAGGSAGEAGDRTGQANSRAGVEKHGGGAGAVGGGRSIEIKIGAARGASAIRAVGCT